MGTGLSSLRRGRGLFLLSPPGCQVCINTGGHVCSSYLPTPDPPLAGFEASSPSPRPFQMAKLVQGTGRSWEGLASRCQPFRRNRGGLRFRGRSSQTPWEMRFRGHSSLPSLSGGHLPLCPIPHLSLRGLGTVGCGLRWARKLGFE